MIGLEAELLFDQGCLLAECPCWDVSTETLLWVDIEGMRIHRAPIGGTVSTIQLDRTVGAAVPRIAGGLAAAVTDGIMLLDVDGREERFIPIEADLPEHRMNDAKVDRLGRLWAGTLHREFLPGAGALYRIDPDGSVERVLDGIAVSNGLDWSDDGETMYFVDSLTRRVDVLDVDLDAGRVSNRRTLVELDEELGLPDGLTVDAEGNIWVACWGGGIIHAWAADGRSLAEIRVPTPRTSSCAFGGPRLDRLYITTAQGKNPAHPPPAGGIFVAEPGFRGRPGTPFGG